MNDFTGIKIAELIMQGATLVAVVYYARLTRRIAQEATRQGEQALIPCLLIQSLPSVSDDRGLEEMFYRELPARIVFENVGRGPALNGWFELHNEETGSGPLYREAIPFVRAGGTFESVWNSPGAVPKLARFLIGYESLGGAAYETEIRVRSKQLGRATFRRSSRPHSIKAAG